MPCSCISMFVTILFPSSKIISFYHQTTSFYDQTTSFYIKCSCFYDQIHRIYNQTTSFYDRIPVSTLNAQVSMTKLPESMIKLSVSMIKVPVSILNTQGLLNLPIRQPTNNFPIIQYADDTILIMEADVNQLVCLKEILRKFALSTGLVVNYGKSIMVPINVHPDRMQVLASAFGCAIGKYAFHLFRPTHGHNQTKNGGLDTNYGWNGKTSTCLFLFPFLLC